jgi:hypothetical protein
VVRTRPGGGGRVCMRYLFTLKEILVQDKMYVLVGTILLYT